ncbi:MAG: NUDIX hydrolase [Polyangiales bacterium]
MKEPELPGVRLDVVGDTTATSKCDEGYLRVKRLSLVARYDGIAAPSEPFRYDTVERWNQDAVAVVPHFLRDRVRHVILRSCIRPPLALRGEPIVTPPLPLPKGAVSGVLWEIPAGLVEKDERSPEGLVRCVVRETAEEIGIAVQESDVHPLGGVLFPSAGIIGELIYLYECEVDPASRAEPGGDGSPLEREAQIIELPLATALEWCEAGKLPDVKTELGVRRLASLLHRTGRSS